jgi:hypothetical protein
VPEKSTRHALGAGPSAIRALEAKFRKPVVAARTRHTGCLGRNNDPVECGTNGFAKLFGLRRYRRRVLQTDREDSAERRLRDVSQGRPPIKNRGAEMFFPFTVTRASKLPCSVCNDPMACSPSASLRVA